MDVNVERDLQWIANHRLSASRRVSQAAAYDRAWMSGLQGARHASLRIFADITSQNFAHPCSGCMIATGWLVQNKTMYPRSTWTPLSRELKGVLS
jgi:hypothetical protein